jgi:hypothetical protein
MTANPDNPVHNWVDQLPHLDPPELDGMSICGFLIRRRPGQIGLLVANVLLEFDESDVLDSCELDPPDGLRDAAAIHVRIWLRSGAPLLDIRDSPGLRDALIQGAEPFAVAVRHDEVGAVNAPRYARLEAEYLQRHRLMPLQPG